jgi:hypothetical protein
MVTKNPWRYGDLNELIVKFSNMGATSVVKSLEMILEILRSLDAIDDETARQEAAREASKAFRKAYSNEQ